MIFGMLPMAIGFGEGGSQSAPLGRAVIGGLIVSTFATLTILALDLRHPAAAERPSLLRRSTRWTQRADTMKRTKHLLASLLRAALARRWLGANHRPRSGRLQTGLANRRPARRVPAVPERLAPRQGAGLRGSRTGGPRQHGQARRTAGRTERAGNDRPRSPKRSRKCRPPNPTACKPKRNSRRRKAPTTA